MFAASFDSKMGCLYSVFDVKKQGKTVWVVRARNWKLRGGENRLSGLLEGVSVSGNVFTWLSSGLMMFGGLDWAWVVYRSWTFGFDSDIPRVTISGRFCDWTGSRGLHMLVSEPGYAIIGMGNEETLPPPPPVGGETNEDEVTWEILLVGLSQEVLGYEM
ncbi:hypothetical protein GQ457_10G003670 [Hibiscus cannabinus]